jgi:hypothetical protein
MQKPITWLLSFYQQYPMLKQCASRSALYRSWRCVASICSTATPLMLLSAQQLYQQQQAKTQTLISNQSWPCLYLHFTSYRNRYIRNTDCLGPLPLTHLSTTTTSRIHGQPHLHTSSHSIDPYKLGISRSTSSRGGENRRLAKE